MNSFWSHVIGIFLIAAISFLYLGYQYDQDAIMHCERTIEYATYEFQGVQHSYLATLQTHCWLESFWEYIVRGLIGETP